MSNFEAFGGKRGFFRHIRAKAMHAIGAYRSVRAIEWTTVSRLVFVCKGNICRSPYASARAHALGVPSVSLGLEAIDGAPADTQAFRIALARGIDLSQHRSARFDLSRVDTGDLLVAFEPWQMRKLMHFDASGLAGITLLGMWNMPVRPYIQDPYGLRDRHFNECFATIDAAIRELIECLDKHHAPARISRLPRCAQDSVQL